MERNGKEKILSSHSQSQAVSKNFNLFILQMMGRSLFLGHLLLLFIPGVHMHPHEYFEHPFLNKDPWEYQYYNDPMAVWSCFMVDLASLDMNVDPADGATTCQGTGNKNNYFIRQGPVNPDPGVLTLRHRDLEYLVEEKFAAPIDLNAAYVTSNPYLATVT
ncbi:hypothetical protein MAR_003521 [Mya arenaria]|uniref:Uncharacterized protein n=1 Tax=Mya arenaria TaxID=6604 RepID=A0ABY7G6A7_MYAAR|nr:hypothetical protein MAR_003521 [Mya arenaria]